MQFSATLQKIMILVKGQPFETEVRSELEKMGTDFDSLSSIVEQIQKDLESVKLKNGNLNEKFNALDNKFTLFKSASRTFAFEIEKKAKEFKEYSDSTEQLFLNDGFSPDLQ